MVKKSRKKSHIMKDTRSQQRKRKRMQHDGPAARGSFATKVIADSWDKEKTVKQNYKQLGLVSEVYKQVKMGTNLQFEKNVEDMTDQEVSDMVARAAEGGESKEGGQGRKPRAKKTAEQKAVEEELVKQMTMSVAPAYKVKSMGLPEQRICMALQEKYGENFKAMARDTEINVHQKTAAELEKRITLLKELQAL